MNDNIQNIEEKKDFFNIYKKNNTNISTLKDCLIFCIFYNYNYYIYKLFLNQKDKSVEKLIFHIRMLFLNPLKSNNKIIMNLMNNFDFSLQQLKPDKKYFGMYEKETKYYKEEKSNIKFKSEKNNFKMENLVYEIPFDILEKKKIQLLSKIINYTIDIKSDNENNKIKTQKIKINKFPKLLIIKLQRSNRSFFCTNFIFPSFFIKKKLTIFAIVCIGDITNKNNYIAFVRDRDKWYKYDYNKSPVLVGSYLDLLTKFETKNYVLEQSEYLFYSEYKEDDQTLGIKSEKFYSKVI